MKVLHISSAMSWRGGEQQIAYLIDELKEQGVESTIFCVDGSALHKYSQNHRIDNIPYVKKSALGPDIAWRLARLCRKHKFDLIHVHDSHGHTFACISATFFGNPAPILLSRRVDFPIKPNLFSRWKYNHSRICRIICVSDLVREVLRPDIRNTDKLVVVHSGIDPERFDEEPRGKLRREFNIPESTRLIGNVAAIAPHKDYYTFIDTAAFILSKRHDVHFFIIGGDGDEKEGVVSYITQKGLDAYITLTGFRNDIPEILPELDIFLNTSKTEGLGSSILDAMACGVPVVATRAGGIPEMVKHETHGLLAPIRDSKQLALNVMRLLDDPDLRKSLIRAGYDRVKDFSKSETARMTLYWYQDCLEEKS